MIEVVPGIQTNNFEDAQKKLDIISKFATFAHIDVCDGRFVPNLTTGVQELLKLKTELDFNLHLMIKLDGNQIFQYCRIQAKTLIFYPKATPEPETTVAQIKETHKKIGIALDPEDSVESVKDLLTQADLALVLAVPSGFAGQQFQAGVLSKISEIREINPRLTVGVDGGIKVGTANLASIAGADFVVANTAIWEAQSPELGFWALKKDVSGSNR